MVNPMAAPSLPTRPAASAAERADVTVILTCFERPQMYRQQLDALRNQTMQPAVTMAWVNTGSVPQDERAMSAGEVVVIRSNVNMGPWVRFTMAREARTKYVCILDDDTIPGRGWIQACIERLEQAEADAIEAGDEEDPGTYCIAAAGEVFRSDDPKNRYYIGPQSPRDEEMEVDIGRQGWFFRRDMIQAFLNYPRQGDGTIGWGLHFAAALQMLGVLTVVLPYEYENKEAWGMLQPASMENSLSSKLQAQAQAQGGKSLEYMRAEIYQAYRHVGWAPLVVLDAEMDEEEASAGG